MAEILVEVISHREKNQTTIGELSPTVTFPKFANFNERAAELGESISKTANLLRESIDTHLQEKEPSNWGLDTVEMKFSLDLEAEAGVVITKAKATAGFEVTLSWKRN